MKNSSNNPGQLYDNVSNPGCKVVNPSSSYTVGAEDNVVICGANSLVITLDSTSNSPVYISSVDGVTQRTGTTILIVVPAGTQDWVLADGGAMACCTRIGSGPLWAVVGAKTAS